jgi:hypothetical protein
MPQKGRLLIETGPRSSCDKNVVPTDTEAVSDTCAMTRSASANCTGL